MSRRPAVDTRKTRRGTRKTAGTPSDAVMSETSSPGRDRRDREDLATRNVYADSARDTLSAIVSDPAVPAMARAAAARTLAEMAGVLGRHQQAPRDRAQETRVALLTRAELERELARLRAVCAGDTELSP